ncbi:MAG TPA: hypothetical protein VGW74_18865, partial [Propionibacteriaceae bacterium]|nr:hypothetical protein [Propionibacteriaceae bacterium]
MTTKHLLTTIPPRRGRDVMTDQASQPTTDSPWTVAPAAVRYMVLGEEGGESLMVCGHDVTEDSIAAVIRHAGFGRILDPITINGQEVACTGTAVAELHRFETWAREDYGCPRHRKVPWWLRRSLVVSVDAVRFLCFLVAWRLWRSKQDLLADRRVPAWLRWLGGRWRGLSDCDVCEYVDHYRTCRGCGFCTSDG